MIRRHNRVRDLLTKLLDGVTHRVQVKPPLQLLTGERLYNQANQENDSRLDIAARGFWQEHKMALF